MKTEYQIKRLKEIKRIVKSSVTWLKFYIRNTKEFVDGEYSAVITAGNTLDYCSNELNKINLHGKRLRKHYQNLREQCDQIYSELNTRKGLTEVL